VGDFELAPNASKTVSYNIPIKKITTRIYYSGTHKVELQINGEIK
jgi:hypothetical protein